MSLRRVSSRPRLCSFDEFNVIAKEDTGSETSSDTEDDSNQAEQQSLLLVPLKRKRASARGEISSQGGCEISSTPKQSEHSTINSTDVLHVISPEVEPENNSKKAPLSLASLPHEVQLAVLQMLDVDSLRNVMQVDQEHCALLTSSAAVEAIWKPACQQQWPWTAHQKLVNHSFSSKSTTTIATTSTNHPFLLSLACEKELATKIDESLFTKAASSNRRLRSLRSNSSRRRAQQAEQQQPVELVTQPSGAVQFTGTVGVGDRCIRANAPLPRPEPLPDKNSSNNNKAANIFSRFARKHPVLCRYDLEHDAVWKPFVAPFAVAVDPQKNGNNNTNNQGCMDVTPRLVSYYEVSILEAPQEPLDTPARRPSPLLAASRHHRSVAAECVAVGLATNDFHLHTRMPGWDRESFGYHGDDGGIFHNSGSMLSQLGTPFGVGDTIGCGVDYQRQAIFYTRNGVFVGYAFALQEAYLRQDLFPVVGVDAHCPVSCNFGTEKPFLFDLQAMIAKHDEVVRVAIRQQKQRSGRETTVRSY